MVSDEGSKNLLKKILGFGYWVQGLRCFPWMAVNFYLKDGLNLDPSSLQILMNSANLPMVGKPLYGVISDAVYIKGQHRIPYIAIGVLLQALSWLAIALLPPSTMSIFVISLFLLLSNLGASVVEVANDALVAESGKQPTAPKKSEASSSSGQLQSFVWMCVSVGGVLGNLLGGIAIKKYSPQFMFLSFGILLVLQFFITVAVREKSLNLPKSSSNSGIRKQLSELSLALRRPDIAYSIVWFAASFAVVPILTGTMFFYQTQHLKLDSSVLGISKVFGQMGMLVWGSVYNGKLKSISPRKLMSAVQATTAVLMLSDVLFVNGTYLKMGIPNSVYVVIFSGLLEILLLFKVLPFSVLIAQLCPRGCEGSLVAFVMSAIALASIVSGYFGVALASYTGVTGEDFSGLPKAIVIQAACTVLPLFFSSWIHSDNASPQLQKQKNKKKN
ncbi:hypothetical protein MKW94_001931 [Papaver nudicaule]|uniref:Folate-biopterin transporter 7 n=1 Tax=Papaver nudicaule TaxID=74823 RepID=A0AA41SLL2_PAPNU|nr:hypothetical protein [Papaver nudicaule]MCL7037661.1 hypothetical protein [Papaver nudicaule]